MKRQALKLETVNTCDRSLCYDLSTSDQRNDEFNRRDKVGKIITT